MPDITKYEELKKIAREIRDDANAEAQFSEAARKNINQAASHGMHIAGRLKELEKILGRDDFKQWASENIPSVKLEHRSLINACDGDNDKGDNLCRAFLKLGSVVPKTPAVKREQRKKTNRNPATESVKISSLVVTTGTQIRACVNDSLIEDFAEDMEAGDSFPSIVLFRGPGGDILADGFHRVWAATRIGKKEINADIRSGSKSDALRYALSANSAHGQRRTNADKRRSVALALAEWPKVSDREIAEICAVGNHLVADVRKQVGESPTCPKVGRDGKSYPAKPQLRVQKSESEEAVARELKDLEEKPRVKSAPKVIELQASAEIVTDEPPRIRAADEIIAEQSQAA